MSRLSDFHSIKSGTPAVPTARIKFPIRASIGVMILISASTTYLHRVNLSMALISMVLNRKNTNFSCEEPGKKFDWSTIQEGYLISAYFCGYFSMAIPAWLLVKQISAKWLIGVSMIIITILTGLIPMIASWNFYGLFVIRVAIGGFSSVFLPGFYRLLGNWTPIEEAGKCVTALFAGGIISIAASFQISGFIQSEIGWEWSFYSYVIINTFVIIAWLVVVSETPIENKWVTQPEIRSILASIDTERLTFSKNIPVWKIAQSSPFWALLFLHFSYMWGLCLYLTSTPKFLHEVLYYTPPACGFLSSVPPMAGVLSTLILRQIADSLIKWEILTAINIRKLFCILSHIIPGVAYALIGFYGTNSAAYIMLLITAFIFHGAIKVTSIQCPEKIAPNWSTSLFGLINFITIIPGIIIPILVGYFTRDKSTLNEWRWIYFTAGIMSIVSALFFAIFGSEEVEKWNEI